MEKKYTLVDYNPTEGKIALDKFNAFCSENMMEIKYIAGLTEDGRIGARGILMKKVELVPKVESEVVLETPKVDAPTIDATIKQTE